MSTTNGPNIFESNDAATDAREALFNAGDIGPIRHVQVSTERITALRGILFDLDPDIMIAGAVLPQVPSDPVEFYTTVVRPMLDRHPVLAKTEVRNSGRGLHVILRFDPPIEFNSDGERDRWAGIINVVQAALPIDPDQPGITATTRAVGGINSKNGAEVKVLAEGIPVTAAEVLGLYDEMIDSPFKMIMHIMTGDTTMQPCPICGKQGTELSALNQEGKCYGGCGKVKPNRFYNLVLAPRNSLTQEGSNDA